MTREEFQKRLELGKQSSMSLWYPEVSKLLIPQIETHIVKVGNDILSDWVRNDKQLSDKYWKLFEDAINKIDEFPIFLRTDQSSMKHSWKDTCYLKSRDNLKHNLSMLLEEHEMQNMVGELTYDDIVFRKFIPLETSFTCFHSNFPVNKEVRCFIKNGKILDLRHYWVKGAIESGTPDDDNWEIKLMRLKELTHPDINEIIKQLEKVCKVFNEYWSVDFAKSKDGIWYLIDMARGEVSYQSDEIIMTVQTNGE